MKKLRTHDEYLRTALKDPKEAALYLNAAAADGDPALILAALSDVARAHGMGRTAKKVAMTRMGLYKAVSEKGNPGLRTFLGLLSASGLKMTFRPA